MKELIVISDPQPFQGEGTLLNSLFDAGLQLLHLRKPGCAASVYTELITAIDTGYHDRIVLPYTCLEQGIADQAGCRQLHVFEQLRHSLPAVDWRALKEQGYRLSTSIHDAAAYHALPAGVFGYTFLGPVFSSISKPGYAAMDPAELAVLQQKHATRIIGLGGIDESNCGPAIQNGFDGVAIAGALWQRDNPLATFKQIQQCITTDL